MTRRAASWSNDPAADEGAALALAAGGSAVGAVLAGWFAAAGAAASVLLGPVTILVAGTGTAPRAFDGRMRQPGIGQKRPRAAAAAEPTDAARVAIPTSLAAAMVANAYDGGQRMASLLRPGIQRAQRAGAAERAAFLGRVREVGGAALGELAFVRALQRVAGASQGGLVGPGDFAPGHAPVLDVPAETDELPEGRLHRAPWASEPGAIAAGTGAAVVAIDVRGVCAALTFRRTSETVSLDDYELELPLLAVPVRKGVTRVPAGQHLPTPAPVAVLQHADGRHTDVLAWPAHDVVDLGRPAQGLRLAHATGAVQSLSG